MGENRTDNVIKNSIASIILKLVGILSQFILRTVFIYVLGKAYTGISGLFTDILNVLSLMEMGLDASMIYALFKPLAEQNESKISALMNYYRKAFALIGVIVFIAGMACIPFLDYIVTDVPDVKEDIRGIFSLYVITTASSYFYIYKSVLLRADQKTRIISKCNAITQIVETILEAILLIIFKEFYLYLVLHFIATLAMNIILSRISSNKYPQYFKDKTARLSKEEKSILFRDLMCMTAYNVSGVVINSTDSIFVSAFVGTVEVAIIGNYTLIINSIRTCVSQIVNATKPSIGNMAVTSTKEKQEEVFNKMNFISFYVSCVCCACFAALLTPFIGDIWFNPEYKISIYIVAILCVNFYIAVMIFPVESFRTANGLFVQGWKRPIVMAIMNIVLDFVMGKKWGITGIFLATTISRVLTQVWFDPLLIYRLVFKSKVSRYYLDYLIKFVNTCVICAVTWIICSYIPNFRLHLDFVLKMILAVVIPNILLILEYRNNPNLNYIYTTAKSKLHKK